MGGVDHAEERRTTMSKHSPGPWTYGESGMVVAGDRNRVCQLMGATVADACAITAAPEMVELLRQIFCSSGFVPKYDEIRALLKRIDGY